MDEPFGVGQRLDLDVADLERRRVAPEVGDGYAIANRAFGNGAVHVDFDLASEADALSEPLIEPGSRFGKATTETIALQHLEDHGHVPPAHEHVEVTELAQLGAFVVEVRRCRPLEHTDLDAVLGETVDQPQQPPFDAETSLHLLEPQFGGVVDLVIGGCQPSLGHRRSERRNDPLTDRRRSEHLPPVIGQRARRRTVDGRCGRDQSSEQSAWRR